MKEAFPLGEFLVTTGGRNLTGRWKDNDSAKNLPSMARWGWFLLRRRADGGPSSVTPVPLLSCVSGLPGVV